MYRVTLFEDSQDKKGIVLHEPANYGNKVNAGNLELSLEGLGISTFEFSINVNNPLYRKAEPIVNLVTVSDRNGQIFKGRVAKISNTMSGEGHFIEKILCEDQKAYLYDSTQKYIKSTIMSVSQFLGKLLNEHNDQVENHKKIYLGTVTVTESDKVYRGSGYGKTADIIKNQLLDRLGGYLVLREKDETLYLDYLAEYGSVSTTPLQIARNLKSASREIDISELATRIVPLGKDLELSESTGTETDQFRPKTTIETVNNGKNYLEDQALVKKFGVIQTTIEFPNIADKNTLKRKGQEFLNNQRLLLITWTAEVIELGLLDKRYEIIQLGNSYSVANPFLYEKETLQVIEKKIDILNPQKIRLTIGSGKKTLSQYQLEYKGMQETLEVVKNNVGISTRTIDGLKQHTQELQEKTAVLPEFEQTINEQKQGLEEQGNKLVEQAEMIQTQDIKLTEQQIKIEELFTLIKELQKK
ncbi:phage tail protein [Enterococcus quebecensis]|uniref:Tail spike domain-containing protein n=1 Tax=Enterococcus quebecensis TaxID=903983 RepID=A0A1E5GUN1_9ENTE|nr:phage tail protein [Enterococcus quebecensis]OEG16381.1 hypothetical protein BCR23_05685 [Enterococcus quebecensis]OJG72748.1 phage minor structural protein [Enterococcus quebecensis]